MRQMTSERFQLALATAESLGARITETVIDRENARASVADWNSRGITAVAAFNDEVAALVLGAAIRLGVSVPDELAIIGHDDIPLAQLVVPSLSTVRVDTSGLGKYFAAVAVSAARNSPTPQISPQEQRAKLVVRESS